MMTLPWQLSWDGRYVFTTSSNDHNNLRLKGLASKIDSDGSMLDIIGGTGIQNTEEDYNPESMEFSHASPGVGAVLSAIAEIFAWSADNQ